jgi:hypothetical protein
MAILLGTLLTLIGVKLLMAWLLQAILSAFGFTISYWLCFGILFLVSAIFSSKGGE